MFLQPVSDEIAPGYHSIVHRYQDENLLYFLHNAKNVNETLNAVINGNDGVLQTSIKVTNE